MTRFALLLVLCGCASTPNGGDAGTSCPPLKVSDAGFTPLTVAGDLGSTQGIFDPSLAFEANSTGGLLTYSTVPTQRSIHTRLAASTDRGATWTFVADVNASTPMTISTNNNDTCGASTCNGDRVHETSSLIIDATDSDPSARLKVFTHSYFINDGGLHYDIGTISMWTSPFPLDGGWVEHRVLGWNGQSTESTQNVQQNASTAFPKLADCVILAEPGALMRGTTLDLALGCVRIKGSTPTIDVVLLRSEDHGKTFTFVSTLVAGSESPALGIGGNAQVNAAQLLTDQGRTFLILTPTAPISGLGVTYGGCYAYEFDDVDAGTLKRCGGKPQVAKQFTMSPTFSGACTWAPGSTATGTVMSVAMFTAGKPQFAIFSTHDDPH